MSANYRYALAYDCEPDNPNPHAWEMNTERWDTEAEAVAEVERYDRELQEDGYGLDEVGRWIVVRLR